MKNTILKFVSLSYLTIAVGIPMPSPSLKEDIPTSTTRLEINLDNYDIVYMFDFNKVPEPQIPSQPLLISSNDNQLAIK